MARLPPPPPPPSPAPTLPPCPRGLTAADLSAYRDGQPVRGAGDDTAALDAHIAGCPACRARMAPLEQLADALRAERAPEPDERLWRAVRHTAEEGARPRYGRRRPRITGWLGSSASRKRPLWSGLGAVAAVLLLVLGFAQFFALHSASPRVTHAPTVTPLPTLTPLPTATATPTPTPLPVHPLAWQPGVSPIAAGAPMAAQFANDGESAYLCEAGEDAHGNGLLQVWHTTDRGARWVPAQQVPQDPTTDGCELVVDSSDPSVAAMVGRPRGGNGDSYTALMITTDGGATWQTVPSQSFNLIDQLDSRSGVIYALRETTASDGSAGDHLWASRDRMRSWQQVDHGLADDVAGFWLQPDGPGILAVLSGGAYNTPTQLWSSPDDGATWRQITTPGSLPSYTPARFTGDGELASGIVARWFQERLDICVSGYTVAAPTPSAGPMVTCSTDGGNTWHARGVPSLVNVEGASVVANLVAITNDGTLLAAGLGTLYRLAASADTWESLGTLPLLHVTYCPASGAGMLWVTAAVGAAPDQQNHIFTAAYTP